MGKFIDLTGMKFGRLTVIERGEDYINHGVVIIRWKCKCDCGKITLVRGSALRGNLTRSCGCLKDEIAKESKNKKYNTYNLSGKYGVGYTSKGQEFYFDLEDYDKIKEYCWYINSNGYVYAHQSGLKGKYISLHRLVLDFPEKFVDHKERNRNDCRKESLREANTKQNSFNKSLLSNNKSGYIGISWSKEKNKWESRLGKKFLGYFSDKEKAVFARLRAEKKYFGDFAPQQHLFEKYGISQDKE